MSNSVESTELHVAPPTALQVGSPFNLKQPFNLLAFLHQEERVSSLEVLREELLDFRNEFEEYGNYDSFEDSFYALDQECRLVQSLTSFDVYISTVLPLEHKKIRYCVFLFLSLFSFS